MARTKQLSRHQVAEALRKRAQEVQRLAEAGINITTRNTAGETLLHEAVKLLCPEEVLRQLLDAGADPSARSNDAATPLHGAVAGAAPDARRDTLGHGILVFIHGNPLPREGVVRMLLAAR